MLALLAALYIGGCAAEAALPPAVAIVIDDLGYRPRLDHAAIALPRLTSFAILPHTPLARTLAERLAASGKEVLLHLPMEARAHNELLGPGALRAGMTRAEFVATAHAAFDAVPQASAVNNHMGSLLTGDAERMGWLMEVVAARGPLVFLDSRTTAHSAARAAARAAAVPFLARDVFLDHQRDTATINARLDELVRHAELRGDAIGIGHPYPETLAVLRARLPGLATVRVVSLAALRRARACRARHAADLRAASAARATQRGDGDHHAERAQHPYADR
ncbi:MAG: divergent polysaccharide deacetylase family protein [Gammaproteobacteria bacterium]